MKVQKSNNVSAIAIVIETRNNGLRNRKLDSTRYALLYMYGMTEDYKDKNSAISKWLVLFFRLPLLPSDEVGTAFANEIMCNIV